MRIVQTLAGLTLRPILKGFLEAAGGAILAEPAEKLVGVLIDRFTSHSGRVSAALAEANDRAWKSVEVALAGGSWLASADVKDFAAQVDLFLKNTPLGELGTKARFREVCLNELKEARKAGLLPGGSLDMAAVLAEVGPFARFDDPTVLLDAEWQMMDHVAEALRQADHGNLGDLVSKRPANGLPILVAGARFFFRLKVETDRELFQGLAFAQLQKLSATQEIGFAAIGHVLDRYGERLHRLLEVALESQAILVETHEDVLDVKAELKRLGAQLGPQVAEALRPMIEGLLRLQQQHRLEGRVIQFKDGLSYTDENELRLITQLVQQFKTRYRSLSEDQRRQLPATLCAVGQLEHVAGDFSAAKTDHQAVASMVKDDKARGEAHFNAYRSALEARDWDTALAELKNAVRIDAARFAPFPMGRYEPQRILGGGGFGVAFLCRHKYSKVNIVVKSLLGETVDRGVDVVFTEAQALGALDHPAIIRVQDCGYALPSKSLRPYIVMDYFEGLTLEEYVGKHQPIPAADFVELARLIAGGLQAAHGRLIWHRDIKPANVLVRRDSAGFWQVKVIDFGLALRSKTVRETRTGGRTLLGRTIAGTMDYAAPEQMGKLPGVLVSARSDIYGFGRTCCYALFGTPHPVGRHWRSLPTELAELLEGCLEQQPADRPESFAQILGRLQAAAGTPIATAWAPASPEVIYDVLPADPALADSGVHGTAPAALGRASRLNEPRAADILEIPLPGNVPMKLAYVPEGSFWMGSPVNEKERRSDEDQHLVKLTRGFYIGIYPVTQRHYEALMKKNPSHFTKDNGGGPDHPVEQVTWDDARAFCQALSELPPEKSAGRFYRLPTEAEWEFACRGGPNNSKDTCPFYLNSPSRSLSSEQANFNGKYTYGNAEIGPFLQRTTRAGSYEPNALGLYDMHGNVWEWCADWYDENYYARSPKEDPQGPQTGERRVLRGGSWFSVGGRCRAAYRGGDVPGYRGGDFGFRVCCVRTR